MKIKTLKSKEAHEELIQQIEEPAQLTLPSTARAASETPSTYRKPSVRTRKNKTVRKPLGLRKEDKQFINELTTLNNDKFSYMNINRNQNAINMFKTQINQMISNYGCDLQYFRKYNTFFKEGEENKANMVYGEDTTAEFYASGMIRAFVSVENMGWSFNQLGLDNTEQVILTISIENFEQAFANKISKTKTGTVEIPVEGNVIYDEFTGKLRLPECDASVYGHFNELTLETEAVTPKIIKKEVNTQFFMSKSYDTSDYEISGTVSGKLHRIPERPTEVSGIVSGELSYHGLENLEDSSTWKLAPQVGDYFKFSVAETGINEEWEINQIFDRQLQNKSGINPLLGKYIYQITAVKRQDSYEMSKEELDHHDEDTVEGILGNIAEYVKTNEDINPQSGKKKNKQNVRTNQAAKSAYDYSADKSDEVYGGYQNLPKSK